MNVREYRFERDVRNENEKRIFEAIDESDVETLKKLLKNPGNCRFGNGDLPILMVAVLKGDREVVKFLIDNGCDPLEADLTGNSILSAAVSVWYKEHNTKYAIHQAEVVEILLAACPMPIEAVFFNANKARITPFLMAAALGYDEIVLRFLALLGNNSIQVPIDKFIGYGGNNIFHFILQIANGRLPPSRLEIVRALIDKLAYFIDRLIDAKNIGDETPFQQFLSHECCFNNRSDAVVELAKIFFRHGVLTETRSSRRGYTLLERALMVADASLVETCLRAGCRLDYKIDLVESPLSYVLKYGYVFSKSESIRIIELLLAFGYDLQKESYLNEIDEERPIDLAASLENMSWSLVDRNMLKALRVLRRSNELLSLQRRCRNVIRRSLRGKPMKSFEI